MNTEHILTITLTVRGPVLVKGTSPAAFGVDAPVARVAFGPHKDKLCIHGTLLKGKLAEALAQLGSASPSLLSFAERWLGKISDDRNGNNDPFRGRLQFDDLVSQSTETKKSVRHRIAINEELGSVEEQMLQVMEMPFAPGAEVVFKGEARFFADEVEAKQIEDTIRLGVNWLTQVGGERTVGFGRILRACVTRSQGRPVTPLTFGTPPDALNLVIKPLGPICISKHKIGNNLFESEDFIPGNVLAGALAETWAALIGERLDPNTGVTAFESKDPSRALLAKHFSQLRFRHAFPVSASTTTRPKTIPHSVVKGAPEKTIGADRSVFRDVAAFASPVVFKIASGHVSPAFRTDWKPQDFEAVDCRFGQASPAKELRVRTAINSLKRRADDGKEKTTDEAAGKLFAWEMVHPWENTDNPNVQNPIVWRGRIDLDEVPATDRAKVAEQLTGLLSVLSFVSKTKTACDVTPTVAEKDTVSVTDKKIALVLQTPALLCDPRFQNQTHGALSKEELHALYAATWKEISDDSLQLSHYFASQSLAGGEYLYHRFQKRAGKPYNPWLLTDEGSVFVFTVNDATKAKTKIEEWLARGLPLPSWAKGAFTSDWKTNPYLPQNGFGEIAIHKSHPFTPAPAEIEIKQLTW